MFLLYCTPLFIGYKLIFLIFVYFIFKMNPFRCPFSLTLKLFIGLIVK